MGTDASPSIEDVLLVNRGVVLLGGVGVPAEEAVVRGAELELAEIGYLPTARLRARMKASGVEGITRMLAWCLPALVKHVGGGVAHVPLFRSFPEGIPDDTRLLWWRKVLVHFVQAEGQPCLFCGARGTTRVLRPCGDVVCDRCFDGRNYSACPACEHKVDADSPFVEEIAERERPVEPVRYKVLDLGTSIAEETRGLFRGLCERTQALSPQDRVVLDAVVAHCGVEALSWLPEKVPVRENVAAVFGGLLRKLPAAEVMPYARPYLTTATDVLRLIAVMSGADGSLQAVPVVREIKVEDETPTEGSKGGRFWAMLTKMIRRSTRPLRGRTYVAIQQKRFKVAKMSRGLRRELLAVLDGMPADRLTEDLLRHRSYWVWVGEFLHPGEYEERFPRVAQAFRVVRRKDPAGKAAPKFRNWYGRVDAAFAAGDIGGLMRVLAERPGEFGRRLDRVLRGAKSDAEAAEVAEALGAVVPRMATPMLLTSWKHLRGRGRVSPVRVYWPKGKIAKGVGGEDRRATIPESRTGPIVERIRGELLARFGAKEHFGTAVVDEGLAEIAAPFNERTASVSAVALPRGSRIDVRAGAVARLFLHWCEPVGGRSTDIDLSVALYDERWVYKGVCSYYQLKVNVADGSLVAQSSGDLRNGPWPEGATEFVDVHRDAAGRFGARYAVMVVNAYSGMSFSTLARGFAGVMFRDDTGGEHFDPRTVELRFALDGENGVFMPLVLDLAAGKLHWLDVQSKGQMQMNNVERSKSDIARVCPRLMTYFGSGARPTMYELGILHAAARCGRVLVRGAGVTEYVRGEGETAAAFHGRLLRREGGRAGAIERGERVLALLVRGDIDLAEGSGAYAVFRERVVPTMSAGDLLSTG